MNNRALWPFAPSVQLLLLVAGLLLPFIHRPLFVDDHAHFSQAVELGQRSQLFYREGSASLGWSPGRAPGEANGPLYFYLFGKFTAHAGTQLWKSHLLMGLITLCGALALYALAKEYTAYPVLVAFLWLSSPHAWVTANSLLVDAVLGPFCLLAMYGWIIGWRQHRPLLLALGVVALAMLPLIKYTGLLVWLIAAAWAFLEPGQKRTWRWLWFCIPAVTFLSWLVLSHQSYGESHFLAVARAKMVWPTISHALIVAVFAAATTPACWIAAAAGLASTRSLRWSCIGILSACVLAGSRFSPAIWGLQLGLWTGVFAVWMLTLGRALTRQERGLTLWAAIGLGGLVIAIPWVCARYLVIAGPALVLLSITGLERLKPTWLSSPLRRIGIASLVTVVSALIAWSDYTQAQSDSQGAVWAESWRAREMPQHPGFFPAATLGGFGYSLAKQGWQPLNPGDPVPAGGLLALTPRTLAPHFWPSMNHPRLAAQHEVQSLNPIRLLDRPSGAGFYGSIWGPLPYSFSRQPLETYNLLIQP